MLGCSKDRHDVIAGMVDFVGPQIGVHKVEVTHKTPIVERSSIRRRQTAPDEGAYRLAPEGVDNGLDIVRYLGTNGTDGTTDGIE